MPEDEITQLARARLGRVLRGKYRLDRILGIGGMAVVYAATHRNKKRVAIKMLHPELSIRENMRARFLREGYVANSVGHSGAVAVADDDVAEDGAAFVVMELLDGAPLDEISRQYGGRVPLPLVVSIGDALLDVLTSAHAHGIVHRDLKPANLFLTRDGKLKVLDFGIARLRDETSASETATGAMLGTPAFMAPEQALGESADVDSRTDLWAVGATLFELLAGRHVHPGEHASQLLVNAATKKAPQLAIIAPEVPAAVAAAIDKALAFEKKDRWASAKEMRDALVRGYADATGAEVPPLPKTEKVTGLEETIASDADLASGPSGVGFEPTVDASSPREASSATTARGIAGEVGAGHVGEPASGGRARSLALLAVVLAVGGGAIALASSALDARSAARATSTSDAGPRGSAGSTSAEAEALYSAGLRDDHDGATSGCDKFSRAALVDAGFAAAHLRAALCKAWSNPTIGRDDFRRAAELRSTLGEHDQRLLDAHEPLFQRQPADIKEARRRLLASSTLVPDDVDLLFGLALADGYFDIAEGVQVLDRLLAVDPTYVNAWSVRGQFLAYKGDFEGASQSVDRCLGASPQASGCLLLRLRMSEARGECAQVETDARRWLTIDTGTPAPYFYLAEALIAQGRAAESVQELVAQELPKIPEALREKQRLQNARRLALHEGDFVAGARLAEEELELVRGSSLEVDHAEPAAILVATYEESARPADAARVARDFLARRDAWEPDPRGEDYAMLSDPTAPLLGVLCRARSLSEDECRKRRTERVDWWESEAKPTTRNFIWPYLFATGVATEAEARDALAALPRYEPLPPYTPRAPADVPIGRTFLLAGRIDDAIKALERAVHSCYALRFPIEHTQASYLLGLALEARGDVPGACGEYARVRDRWGAAKPRSVTMDATARRMDALRCAGRGASPR